MQQALLLDLGNTRLKWRLGMGAVHSAADLASFDQACAAIAKPAAILACVVGDEDRFAAICALCQAHWQMPIQRLQVSHHALGVTNHYWPLSQQGCDRWAAVLGAKHHFPTQNLLIVSAGTALVVDTLSRDGHFLGGTISPGLGLMKASLQQATAKLPLAQGQYQAFPSNTHDAIETGCLRAITGIISQANQIAAFEGIPIERIILFGGDAAQIQAQLNVPAQTVDNLVLDGLYALHCAAEGAFTQ